MSPAPAIVPAVSAKRDSLVGAAFRYTMIGRLTA